MKRSAPGINAGSMADMAFLLLVFFLLVTRIDDEVGINAILPEWDPIGDPTIVADRNLLMVDLLEDGSLMVEGERGGLADLQDAMRTFYLNSGIISAESGLTTFPERVPADLSHLREGLDSALKANLTENERKQLNMSNQAFVELGSFRLLPENACILLSVHDSCDYENFITLQDDMRITLRAIKTDFAAEHFAMSLEEMKEKEMNTALAAIEWIFPLKIVEQEKAEQVTLLDEQE